MGLDHESNPLSARRIYSMRNAFNLHMMPDSSPMPEQSLLFHRYKGCEPDAEKLEHTNAQQSWSFYFPFPAYVYQIQTDDWVPETICGRMFPHVQRLIESPISNVLHAVHSDLERRSQLLVTVDPETGVLVRDTQALLDEQTKHRIETSMSFTCSVFGFSEMDTAEEMQEKRLFAKLLAIDANVELEDHENRMRLAANEENVVNSLKTRDPLVLQTQMSMALQNYTSAFGPIVNESRRNRSLLDELSACYARVMERARSVRNILSMSQAELNEYHLSVSDHEKARRDLEYLTLKYDYMLEARDFLVVMRKIYLMNQDMVLSRYEGTCNHAMSDISPSGKLLKREQAKFYGTLRERPVTIKKTDPRLDLFLNQEIQFYMETGALYFLSDKNRELSLMWKVRHDAYRVDFGLHYNILLLSEGGGRGKTMLLELIEQMSIQDTTQSVSSSTALGEASDDYNMNDQIVLMDEMSMKAYAVNSTTKDQEQEKHVKERLTRNRITRRRLIKRDNGTMGQHVSYSECIAVHFGTTNADVYELMSPAMLTRLHIITVESSAGSESEEFSIASKNLIEEFLKNHPEERDRIEVMKRRSQTIQLLMYDVEKLIHLGGLSKVTMDGGMIFLLYLERNLLNSTSVTFKGEGRNFQRTMFLARINCILDAITQTFFVPSGRHYGKNITIDMLRDLDPLLYIRVSHVVSAVGEVIDLYVDTSEDKVRSALQYIAESSGVLEVVKSTVASGGVSYGGHGHHSNNGAAGRDESNEANYLKLTMQTRNRESWLDAHARAISEASLEQHKGSMKHSVTYYQARQVLKRWEKAQLQCWPLMPNFPIMRSNRKTPLVERLVDNLHRIDTEQNRMKCFYTMCNGILIHPCFLYPELENRLSFKDFNVVDVPPGEPGSAVPPRGQRQVLEDLKAGLQRNRVADTSTVPASDAAQQSNTSYQKHDGRAEILNIIKSFCRRRYQPRRTLLFDVNTRYSFLRNVVEVGPSEEDLALDPDCMHLPVLAVPNVAYRVDAIRKILNDSDDLDFQSHRRRNSPDADTKGPSEDPAAFRDFLRENQDQTLHYDEHLTIEIQEDVDVWSMKHRLRQLFISQSPVSSTYRQVHLESFLQDEDGAQMSAYFRREQDHRMQAVQRVHQYVKERKSPMDSLQPLYVPSVVSTKPYPFFMYDNDYRDQTDNPLHGRQQQLLFRRSNSATTDLRTSNSAMESLFAPTSLSLFSDESRDLDELIQTRAAQNVTSTRNSQAILVFRYLQQPALLEQRSDCGCFFLGEPLELCQDRMMKRNSDQQKHLVTSEDRIRDLVRMLDLSEYEEQAVQRLQEQTDVMPDELLNDVDFVTEHYRVGQMSVSAAESENTVAEDQDCELLHDAQTVMETSDVTTAFHAQDALSEQQQHSDIYHWEVLWNGMHPLEYKIYQFHPKILEHRYNYMFAREHAQLLKQKAYPEICMEEMLKVRVKRQESELQMRHKWEQKREAHQKLSAADKPEKLTSTQQTRRHLQHMNVLAPAEDPFRRKQRAVFRARRTFTSTGARPSRSQPTFFSQISDTEEKQPTTRRQEILSVLQKYNPTSRQSNPAT